MSLELVIENTTNTLQLVIEGGDNPGLELVLTNVQNNLVLEIGGESTSDGGSAEWGDIEGSISAQTDLQEALDAKEDVENKSTDTDLGTSNILYPTQNAVKTYIDANGGTPLSTIIAYAIAL